jgi:exosortase
MVEKTCASGTHGRDVNSSPPERGWADIGLSACLRILLVAELLCLLYRHELGRLIHQWMSDPNWSHGFIIPLFSLYLLNRRKAQILALQRVSDPLGELIEGRRPASLQSGQTRPNYVGLLLLIGILVFYVFNVVSPSGYAYFRPLSVVLSIAAVVLFLGGWPLLVHAWLPIAFLLLAVPLPRRYFVAMTLPMRQIAAAIATGVLNLIGGFEATSSGVVIDIFYKGRQVEPSLNVEEACSGMRLLMAFVALGVVMAYLHERPLWQRLVLLVSTIPIAVLCNVIRVTATGLISVLIGPTYAQGVYHDLLGLAMLPLAFALYGFLAWFMSSLLIEEDPTGTETVIVRKRQGQ